MNLVWLRNDLRTQDNPALWHACAAGPTLCVFTATPGQWQEHHEAPAKIGLLLAHLRCVAEELAALNIPIKIIEAEHFSDLPNALLSACQEWQVTDVCFNAELAINEQRRDRAVQEALKANHIKVHRFEADMVHQPGDLLTQSGEHFKVFTPFYRRWLAMLPEAQLEPLSAPRPQQPTSITSDTFPDSLTAGKNAYRADIWPAGHDAATAKLYRFISRHHDEYNELRDYPAIAGTSTLSPYLAVGALSVRQCIHALRASELAEPWEQSKWLAELVWREFYRHLIVARPDLCMGKDFKPFTGPSPWLEDEQGWQAWCEGRTGFPIVDAAMRQLNQTGWMHNRLRMVTATFLTKLMMIDWRKGEQYFLEQLVDGDFASNNGGWQWASATGADAAPYFRIFNPLLQSQRFDPDGKFIRRFVPELADLDNKQIHNPDNTARDETGYPQPLIDYAAARKVALERFALARS